MERLFCVMEDTDQTRFVEGAEEYIVSCLEWCGLTPDESPLQDGGFGPYRQSERKATYKQYADQLIAEGHAYYAFDTPEELDAKRKQIAKLYLRTGHESEKCEIRLTLTEAEVAALLAAGTPYVVRIKIPENEMVSFTDLIRGYVSF